MGTETRSYGSMILIELIKIIKTPHGDGNGTTTVYVVPMQIKIIKTPHGDGNLSGIFLFL